MRTYRLERRSDIRPRFDFGMGTESSASCRLFSVVWGDGGGALKGLAIIALRLYG